MDQLLTTLSDEELAVLVQKGNREAFTPLFERYETKLRRYGKKFIGSHIDIEDAVQEVFIKAYTHMHSFIHSKKFSTWIYRIAHNTFINVLKKKTRERIHFFDFDTVLWHRLTDQETPEHLLNKQEEQKLLESGLETLKPKYRETLILYYFEDKSYHDIADIMQVPIATVGIRLKRGKEFIKKILKEKK